MWHREHATLLTPADVPDEMLGIKPCPDPNREDASTGGYVDEKMKIFRRVYFFYTDFRVNIQTAYSKGRVESRRRVPLKNKTSTLIELAKPSFLLEGLKKMIYSGYDALTEQ